MRSFLLSEAIGGDNILPCYFLHGEEVFLARQFIDELTRSLARSGEEFIVERFRAEEKSWSEIIDSVRNLPFFFSPRRIIVVEASAGQGDNPAPAEAEGLKSYLASPLEKTVMIIIYSHKGQKTGSLYKTMASLPGTAVRRLYLKPLKKHQLSRWIEHKFLSLDKKISPEAREKLEEMAEGSLAHLDKEIDKLAAFAGTKKWVDVNDVEQISGWVKTFVFWEISNSLEDNDYQKGILVLDKLLNKENESAEMVVGTMAKFFRDVLLAKLWLRDGHKNKKEIFSIFYPRIKENYRDLYNKKFRSFFSAVERMQFKDLRKMLENLERIDQKIKTTDSSPQSMLERFFWDYYRLRERNPAISTQRR